MIINRKNVYFECDVGWHKYINAVLDIIEQHVTGDIEITQVKEKYGTLRIYYDYLGSSNDDDEDCSNFINACETISGHICEVCGEFDTAKLREKSGWFKTLCDKCGIIYNYKEIK